MNRLKELRQEKKLSQFDIADMLLVSTKTISRWESGESQIKPDKAKALANFFGVSVGYLLGLDEATEPKFLTLDKTRKFFNLSIDTLSVLLGLPKEVLETWENEKNFIPFKEASKLYNYLDITRDNFIKIVADNNLEFDFTIADFFNEIDIEELNKVSLKKQEEAKQAYTFLESYIDDPIKFNRLKKGLSDIDEGYFSIVLRLVIADKELGTNFSDILIDYITLDKRDREIAYDLIKKLASRNTDN